MEDAQSLEPHEEENSYENEFESEPLFDKQIENEIVAKGITIETSSNLPPKVIKDDSMTKLPLVPSYN